MNPQQPLIRPRRLEGKLVDPFAEFQSDNIVHARGPQIATEVVALSIPGLCEPGVDPTFETGAERSIRGQFLIDCVIDLKNARAIDSVPLRTLVPFMWQGFGHRYAIRGAVADKFGAKCLDGSPPTYIYVRRGAEQIVFPMGSLS